MRKVKLCKRCLNDREINVRMTGQKKGAVSTLIPTNGTHYKNLLNLMNWDGAYCFVQEMLSHASLTQMQETYHF